MCACVSLRSTLTDQAWDWLSQKVTNTPAFYETEFPFESSRFFLCLSLFLVQVSLIENGINQILIGKFRYGKWKITAKLISKTKKKSH